MVNEVGAGYNRYEYPSWSQVLGWFIFVLCIIPIPLVYLVNYIKEYRSIEVKEIVRRREKEEKRSIVPFLFSRFRSIRRRVTVCTRRRIMRRNRDFSRQSRKTIRLDSIGDQRKQPIITVDTLICELRRRPCRPSTNIPYRRRTDSSTNNFKMIWTICERRDSERVSILHSR